MIHTSDLEWSDIDWMLNHEDQDHKDYEDHTL